VFFLETVRVAVSKNTSRNYLETMVNVGVFVDDLQPRPSVVDDGELQFPPRSQAWSDVAPKMEADFDP